MANGGLQEEVGLPEGYEPPSAALGQPKLAAYIGSTVYVVIDKTMLGSLRVHGVYAEKMPALEAVGERTLPPSVMRRIMEEHVVQ